MKRILLLCCTCFLLQKTFPQIVWNNPLETATPVVQNQGFPAETGKSFTRLPSRARSSVSPHLWDLSRNAAGLALFFHTDAQEVFIRYAVSGPLDMEHMPSTGVSGIDLYQLDKSGEANFCFGGYPTTTDTITYHYTQLHNAQSSGDYHLYLPMYNTVTWLEIGVPAGNGFSFLPRSGEPPIVAYGTSIAQGGCASRPGMAWTNILQRHLRCPFINLGFSSSGRLEPPIITLVNELNPRLIILDCLPNLIDVDGPRITALIVNAVKQIRACHAGTPVILVEHAGYSDCATNPVQAALCNRLNAASLSAYKILKKEKVKNLHYVDREELGFSSDCWVDYVHYNDFGMSRYAQVLEKRIRKILKR